MRAQPFDQLLFSPGEKLEIQLPSEHETRLLGAELSRRLSPGDVVLLHGPLGAGKTTFVRGALIALGWDREVRSPTFNLIVEYELSFQVMHADLFRVESSRGLGLEEYLSTHICFIEWPDRLSGEVNPGDCYQVDLRFVGDSRIATVTCPALTP